MGLVSLASAKLLDLALIVEAVPYTLQNSAEGLPFLSEPLRIPLPTTWALKYKHNISCWIILASLELYCGIWNQVPHRKWLVAFSILPDWGVVSVKGVNVFVDTASNKGDNIGQAIRVSDLILICFSLLPWAIHLFSMNPDFRFRELECCSLHSPALKFYSLKSTSQYLLSNDLFI